MSYNPVPTRVWSRVQGICTYVNSDVPNSTLTPAEAEAQLKILYKGNILQYKKNSAMLTKNQTYSRIARGYSNSRTRNFATQTQTYTNPNTLSLLRLYYKTFPYPNTIVSAPNNNSGPFQPNVPSPNNCPSNTVNDGGILVAGIYINPCTEEIVRQFNNSPTVCSPMSASDVPGTGYLCWNNLFQTYYPRYRYTNNNSGTKWPVNYKGLVSAVNPQQVANCLTSNP